MIDACSLKGEQIGGARISLQHANFIENCGGATTADALALIGLARRRVHEQFGVMLEPEVRLVGKDLAATLRSRRPERVGATPVAANYAPWPANPAGRARASSCL